MSTTSIIQDLEGLFKAGAKPTEDDFKKLINTYLVNDANRVGIGTTEPKNNLDVKGKVVIGDSFGGEETAPPDGLIVQGNVGIGHIFADEALHVKGNLKLEEGGLIIGGQEVIDEDGIWQGKFPVQEEEDGDEEVGSTHWTDGNEQVTSTVKVGIGEASPTADLHVNGDVQIDGGNLTLDGLLTRKQVAFTAQGYDKAASAKNERITFETPLVQAQPDSFSFFNDSVFMPDAAHAGTYFLNLSLTLKEQVQPEESAEESSGHDAEIRFSPDNGVSTYLVVRRPGSCLHASASLVHHFDGNTAMSLHISDPEADFDQIILTGYRL